MSGYREDRVASDRDPSARFLHEFLQTTRSLLRMPSPATLWVAYRFLGVRVLTRPSVPILATILLAVLWQDAARGQAFPYSELPFVVLSQLGTVDDLVVLPTGEFLISRPLQQDVVMIADPSNPVPVPLPTGPVTVLAMTLGPDGALYLGDAVTGTVLRHDLTAQTTTTAATGFGIPIDLEFGPQDELYVCDLLTADFFGGPSTVHVLTLVNGVAVTDTILLPNGTGALDVVHDGQGILYIASLAATQVGAFDLAQGTLGALGGGIFLCSDLALDSNGQLLVTTLFESRVWSLDPVSGVQTELTRGLAGQDGLEDMALAANGDLFVSHKSGEVFRIDLTSSLRQVGDARPGETFQLQLDIPSAPNWIYSLGASLTSLTGIPIPGQSTLFPLDPDLLFQLSTTQPRPAPLIGFDGITSAAGGASAWVAVDANPALVGAVVWFAGVAFASPTAPTGSWTVTNPVRVVVRP